MWYWATKGFNSDERFGHANFRFLTDCSKDSKHEKRAQMESMVSSDETDNTLAAYV